MTDDMYEPSEMSVDYTCRDVGDYYGDGDVTIQSTGECVDESVTTSPAHMVGLVASDIITVCGFVAETKAFLD